MYSVYLNIHNLSVIGGLESNHNIGENSKQLELVIRYFCLLEFTVKEGNVICPLSALT